MSPANPPMSLDAKRHRPTRCLLMSPCCPPDLLGPCNANQRCDRLAYCAATTRPSPATALHDHGATLWFRLPTGINTQCGRQCHKTTNLAMRGMFISVDDSRQCRAVLGPGAADDAPSSHPRLRVLAQSGAARQSRLFPNDHPQLVSQTVPCSPE